jgi:alpha-beta hydrolase superfamily lysophospholipase
MPVETFLTSDDGIRLFVRRWNASRPKAACVLVHGIAEHIGRYEGLALSLNARGYSAVGMDHRGHGRSEGTRCDCSSLEDYTKDLAKLIAQTRAENPSLKLILVGHSLGGLIALAYASQHPEGLRGLAVSSPAIRLAFHVPKLKVAVAETLDRVLPAVHIPNGVDPSFLSRDPEVISAYKRDPLIDRSITARCAVTLRDAMAGALSYAPKIRIPCLILQAGEDRICDPDAAAEFAGKMRADLVLFKRYDGFYHELFNEPEKDRVIGDLTAWADRLVAA